MRPDCRANRVLPVQEISGKASPDQILRSRPETASCFSDQSLQATGVAGRRALPLTLESGAFFQMDQTASEDQSIFRYIRECGENSDLDRHLRLCVGGDHQKAAQNRVEPLHNFTDFQFD